MRMFKGQFFIFLILFVRDSSCAIDALYNIGEKVWNFYSMLDKSNLTSTSNPRTVAELFGDHYRQNQNITNIMNEIHADMNAAEASINPEIFSTLHEIVTSNVMIIKHIDMIELFVGSINNDYEKFYRIIFRYGYIPNRPLDDLVISVFPNIRSNIQMIRKIMSATEELVPDYKDLVTAIANYTALRRERLCGDFQPITEILLQLFKIAIVAEVKTSLMTNFLHIYRYGRSQGRMWWKIANDDAKTQFQRYFQRYVITLKENLGAIESLYVRACDPYRGNWTLDENTYGIDGTTQGTIFQYDWRECATDSCQDVIRDKINQCHTKVLVQRSSCVNKLIECVSLGAVQACVLRRTHRFRYVNSTEFGLVGSYFECPEDVGYIMDDENSKYATCACDCDVDRQKISAVIIESAVNSNEVITGLQFNRKSNILYIQPKVGKLEANGYIQPNSERWLPIPKNPDVFQIRAIEESLFFLDDLRLPAGFVLTGVKFIKVKRGLLEGYAIEISGVPFDYTSGKLNYNGKISEGASGDHTGLPVAFEPISSIGTYSLHIPSLGDRRYVKFQRSLVKNDFGQSTLPLFDAIPIRIDPPSALDGIGMFHKGMEGYAGFISLRAYGIKYTEYFEKFTSAHTIKGQMNLFTTLSLN